jgi:hypothetical protein
MYVRWKRLFRKPVIYNKYGRGTAPNSSITQWIKEELVIENQIKHITSQIVSLKSHVVEWRAGSWADNSTRLRKPSITFSSLQLLSIIWVMIIIMTMMGWITHVHVNPVHVMCVQGWVNGSNLSLHMKHYKATSFSFTLWWKMRGYVFHLRQPNKYIRLKGVPKAHQLAVTYRSKQGI